MSLTPGSRLGPYEILAPLGAGGMGEVYRARDAKLGRDIAVKVLPQATASDPDRRQRFEQEARAASALNHPNILTIYDIGEADGTTYIVMELIEGKTLRELVASGEPLPTRRLLDLAVQIADGLAKAHGAGIVHRDLKPENVMISKDGFAKILDFGLAKLTETGQQDGSVLPTAVGPGTAPGTVMGTVGYMSPEQASGQSVDFRSDQFTLGSILYEMATGRRAFARKTGAETLVAIIREEPEPMSQAAPKAPAPVRWIVERCLAKDPEERYASTKDLARDLKSVRDHLTETSFSGGLHAAEPARVRRRGWLIPAVLALLVGAGLGFLARSGLVKPPAPIEFQRLTFQRGRVASARFAPDGQTIVYSAAWEGRPVELFSTRADIPESRSLDLPGAVVLSVSSNGELAVALGRRYVIGYEATGTLARVPLAGGTPREILDGVQDADWSPDGKTLAVCRVVGNRSRLEYPIGKVLYESPGWVSGVRVSPDGKLIAFVEHAQRGNNDGHLKIRDSTGRLRLAGPFLPDFNGLDWSPKGDEVWWGAIQATSVDGRTRTVWSSTSSYIHDVARDGSVLVSDAAGRREIVGFSAPGATPRNLTELNWSFPVDISGDGKRVLFTEQQREPPAVYVRGLDGSPAIRIGDGEGYGFSPDGRWALTLKLPERRPIVLVPTGAGEPRTLDIGNLTVRWANWFPDGKKLLLAASEAERGTRLYVLGVGGGEPRPITPEGVVISAQIISSDGRSIAARGPDGRIAIYPSEPGEPRPVPGLDPDEVPLRWTADGRSLYVTRMSAPPGIIDVVEIATGRRSRWTQFDPPDPSGVEVAGPAVIAPDGKAYVYSYRRVLDDLYLATGMH